MFYPKLQVDNIGQIDLNALWERGIRGILLDIDNTLVSHKMLYPSETVFDFINRAKKAGFCLAIISNNSRKRVEDFTKRLGIDALPRAYKPLKRSFLSAAEKMKMKASQIAVVGDQIFTDIYGGNRCGMYTILVKPLDLAEGRFIKFKRYFEKKVLKQMKKRGIK